MRLSRSRPRRGARSAATHARFVKFLRAVAMQLVAAGAITEDHGMLTASQQLAHAFEPGQLFALDW